MGSSHNMVGGGVKQIYQNWRESLKGNKVKKADRIPSLLHPTPFRWDLESGREKQNINRFVWIEEHWKLMLPVTWENPGGCRISVIAKCATRCWNGRGSMADRKSWRCVRWGLAYCLAQQRKLKASSSLFPLHYPTARRISGPKSRMQNVETSPPGTMENSMVINSGCQTDTIIVGQGNQCQ